MPNRLFPPFVFLLLAAFAGLVPVRANVLRVKPGNTNATADGLSWTNAFSTPTPALAAARKGDEIWLAAGVYPGSFTLPAGVTLLGGFAGGEVAATERNVFTNFSILDGQLRTNVLTVMKGATNDTRVDGLVIRNGFANSGAGLRITGGSPVVANCQFFGNNATTLGNAVYLDGGTTALLTNNYFAVNGLEIALPPTGGGAIALGAANPRIEGNSFVANRARDGGAIYSVGASGTVTGNWFLKNEALQNGGAVACFASATRVTHNRFLANAAVFRGGGVAATDGSAALVFNNAFLRNRAAVVTNEPRGGGGVFVDGNSAATVLNNTLVENLAPVGGILCLSPAATLANNLVTRGTGGIGGPAGLRLRRNNVFANGGTNYVGFADVTGTAGNLSQDPRFAGEPREGNFALMPESPCRNAGETNAVHAGALDLDGQPRTLQGAVDIGADEGDGTTPTPQPRVVHVSPTGSNGQDGQTWATAVASVQVGIDVASRTGGEVWIRSGDYSENVRIRSFTHLYGGFAGDETNRAQRNWRTNVTSLSARQNQPVVQLFELEAGETIDGFTIRNGVANAGSGALVSGDVRVLNNRFEDNQSEAPPSATAPRGGAALFSNGGNPLIANNTFTRNLAFSRSAAVPAEGGALKVVAGAPVIINNVFRGNVVTNTATGGESRGGALFVGGQAVPLLANNTFLGNHATPNNAARTNDLGGAIHWAQGTNAPTTPAKVFNNLIAYNRTGLHFAAGTAPELRHNLVWANDHGDYQRLADPTGSQGNLRADPRLASRFMEPHLAADSPARDAGDAGVVTNSWRDFDSAARVVGSAVDIGADEFEGVAPEVPTPVYFVSPTGTNSNAGTSWDTAKKTVQAALDVAARTGGEVWVKAGTYRENVRVSPFVYLYGGFAGQETNRSARQPLANQTRLDGNQTTNAPVVAITAFGDRGAVDGIRVQNGAHAAGAGFAVEGSPRIERNLIALNDTIGRGGGLFSRFGSPRIAHNVFAVNSADTAANGGVGGALYLDPPAGHRPVVVHNDFLDNSATNGGAAIYLGTNATFQISDNIIAFNASGIASPGATATVERNCLFQNGTNDLQGVSAGIGTLTVDPGFVNWREIQFHLRADSPCLDAGARTAEPDETDLLLAPRLAGTATDLGAVEFHGDAAAPFTLTLTSPADGSRQSNPGIIRLTVDFGGSTNFPALVEYRTATNVVATATSAPFSAGLTNFALGEYAVHALAIMPSGALARSATNTFRVATPLPTVSFPSLTPGRIFEAPFDLNLVAQWNKVGGQVVALDLFTNGVALLSSTNLPATQSVTNVSLPALSVGEYSIRAVATDDLGERGTNEIAFSVRLAPLPSLLSRPELMTNGGLSVAFTVPTDAAAYVLEHSTNLVLWRPLRTNTGGTGTNWIVEPPLTNQAEFFRTRALYP